MGTETADTVSEVALERTYSVAPTLEGESCHDARARLMAEFDERRRHALMHRWLVWAMAAVTTLLVSAR